MAFGGAGAIHAGVQAVDLGIKTVLVPRNASVLSAYGGMVADFKVSRVQSYVRATQTLDPEELSELFSRVQREAEGMLPPAETTRLERYLDMRYEGQVHEVIVPLQTRTRKITAVTLSRAIQDFHDLHEQLYAHKRPSEPVQIVSIRLELTGLRAMKGLTAARKFGDEDSSGARVGARQIGRAHV